ncbi:MAG: hypothetical protein JSU85_10780 [Candidatus Zixiibacteriota bacterium]|nr:MAG: hypothetical protein JSU85_10780 [candidate division Zixibacteria bacterium]
MAFTGDEDQTIKLSEAVKFTQKYRDSAKEGGFLGGYFSRDSILKILDQEDCVGIRIYNGIDGSDKNTYVVVGVTPDEKDMIDGELAEFAIGCPPRCPGDSPLAGTD